MEDTNEPIPLTKSMLKQADFCVLAVPGTDAYVTVTKAAVADLLLSRWTIYAQVIDNVLYIEGNTPP